MQTSNAVKAAGSGCLNDDFITDTLDFPIKVSCRQLNSKGLRDHVVQHVHFTYEEK